MGGKKAIYYKNNPARTLKGLGSARNLHTSARAGKFQLGLNTKGT